MTPSTPRVDYDPIAAQFQQRYRENPLSEIARALDQLAAQTPAATILEAGCGTGRWLAGLAETQTHAQLYGLDYSAGMLAEAQQHPHPLRLIRGTASRLPLAAQTFDLIFCVNALHHFEDPARFIRASHQLLKPGGVLAIIGQVPQDRRNRWYLYDYFDGTYELDLQRFPTWGTVTDWLIAAGFEQIQWQPIQWIRDNKFGREVLQDHFLQKHAVSQLALLSDAAYAAGIAKIEQAIQQAESRGETLEFKAQLRLDMLTATLPKE